TRAAWFRGCLVQRWRVSSAHQHGWNDGSTKRARRTAHVLSAFGPQRAQSRRSRARKPTGRGAVHDLSSLRPRSRLRTRFEPISCDARGREFLEKRSVQVRGGAQASSGARSSRPREARTEGQGRTEKGNTPCARDLPWLEPRSLSSRQLPIEGDAPLRA